MIFVISETILEVYENGEPDVEKLKEEVKKFQTLTRQTWLKKNS
jgi:hypothetical protein